MPIVNGGRPRRMPKKKAKEEMMKKRRRRICTHNSCGRAAIIEEQNFQIKPQGERYVESPEKPKKNLMPKIDEVL